MKKSNAYIPTLLLLFVTGCCLIFSSCTEKNTTTENRQEIENNSAMRNRDSEPEEVEESFLVDNDYVPGTVSFSFGFLWDDPKSDADSIRSAMLEMRSIRHFDAETLSDFGYYHNYNFSNETAFVKIGSFLSQYYTSEDLPSIFESYINYIPLFIPKTIYKEKGFEKMHIQLLSAYRDMYNRECFEEIYDICNNWDEPKEGIMQITNPGQFSCFYDSDGELREYDVFIAYSFWGRRYQQGIHRDIYYILKRIYNIYN